MGNTGSIGDSLLFPAPPPSYDAELPFMIWIDEEFTAANPPPSALLKAGEKAAESPGGLRDPSREKRLFPALFFHSPTKTRHTFLYWHGNSCDLGQIFEEVQLLSTYLNCNFCAIEFPGYGLRNNAVASSDVIDRWGRAAFNFLVWLGIPPQSIICFGRSIGTGPACKLAATMKDMGVNVGGVVLHAPYISVHKIVEEYVPIGSWFIGNYWDNNASLAKLSPDCPVLIIHGQDDEIIPTHHGKDLHNNYDSDIKEGFFPDDSSHNAYYVIDDLGKPIETFLEGKSRSKLCPEKTISIPNVFYKPPKYLTMKKVEKSLNIGQVNAKESFENTHRRWNGRCSNTAIII